MSLRAEIFQKTYDDRVEHRYWNMYGGRAANNVLGRLYSRRAYTAGLIFSRGTFLCDVSKIVMKQEKENDLISSEQIYTYTSTLVAGEKGCTIIAIPKDRLASFLDDNPGVLLSLLGTQITV